jgi:flagella basal body P-ring formation protein FlgA
LYSLLRETANYPMRLSPVFLLLLLMISGKPATAGDWQSLPSIEAAVENFVREKVASQPGEYTISVTHVDSRLRLPKCDRIETWLPPSNRLWGHSSIGVRCDTPAAWSLYVPVMIKVTSNVLVAARPIANGQAIQAEDVQLQQKDVTAYAGSVLTMLDQVVGKNVVTGVQVGAVLRSEMLRAATVILQGQQVKLVAQGAGFKITSEGQAMGNAAAGQVVSVKTRSGQIIKGIAKGEGVVEVYF